MRTVALCVLALLAAPPAQAGVVGPARPSDVVMLAASYDPPTCAGGATGTRLDTRLTADGTYEPLVLPTKRVLILTELRWVLQTVANENVTATLRNGPTTGGFVGLVIPGAQSGASGRAVGEAKFDPGIVVRNPAELCVTLNANGSSTAPGNLSGSGYFAKDK
jgi:hypothetical protein